MNLINKLITWKIALLHQCMGLLKLKKLRQTGKVKKGDVVLILEAMKMQNEIGSPRDGIIERIFIIDGQQVSDKMKLLSLKK